VNGRVPLDELWVGCPIAELRGILRSGHCLYYDASAWRHLPLLIPAPGAEATRICATQSTAT
jgi:hypothetical protein